jgi:hypothetical protein
MASLILSIRAGLQYTHYITPENRADAPSLMPLAKKGMSGDLVASAMKNPLIPFYVKL